MEGELKLNKSFWSSARDIYRLKFPHLLIGRERKNNTLKFKIRYDLNQYDVVLGRDN